MAGGISELLGVVLPGGLAVAAVMLVQAWNTWKESRGKREETILSRWQKELARVETSNSQLKEENDYLELLVDHWRVHSAALEYALRICPNGHPIPDVKPLPARPKSSMTSFPAKNDQTEE